MIKIKKNTFKTTKILFIISSAIITLVSSCTPFNNKLSEVNFAKPECSNNIQGNCVMTGATKSDTDSNLLASNIISGITIFGVTGSALIPSPCTNDNGGSCRITQANKTLLEPTLISSNIKNGISVFGVLGTYTGSNAGSMASNMFRDRAVTQISILSESTTNAGNQYTNNYPGYRAVPRIGKDDDGYTGGNVIYVDRSTWASTACGISQANLNSRIADCSAVFGINATWDGSVKGNSGQSVWKLVTRTSAKDFASNRSREVWRDEGTGLLWSSLVSGGDRNANWCKASGSNNISGNPAAEVDPASYCDSATYQNTTGVAISACFEDGGTNFTDVDADLDPAGKAGLSRSSTPAVSWRLPTINDYHISEANGIRFVLPDMASYSFANEWSSSVVSGYIIGAWIYGSVHGDVSFATRSSSYPVRCVGR